MRKILSPAVIFACSWLILMPPSAGAQAACPEGRMASGACVDPALAKAMRKQVIIFTQPKISYAAPPLLNEKIAKKDYRDVYIDLNSASVAGSKVFFMDLNADGLVAKPGENLGTDSIEQAGKTITFDGDWKKGKMSEAEYLKAFSDADAAYAHALELLIAQLKTLGTQ